MVVCSHFPEQPECYLTDAPETMQSLTAGLRNYRTDTFNSCWLRNSTITFRKNSLRRNPLQTGLPRVCFGSRVGTAELRIDVSAISRSCSDRAIWSFSTTPESSLPVSMGRGVAPEHSRSVPRILHLTNSSRAALRSYLQSSFPPSRMNGSASSGPDARLESARGSSLEMAS